MFCTPITRVHSVPAGIVTRNAWNRASDLKWQMPVDVFGLTGLPTVRVPPKRLLVTGRMA
jgi:hypothetical protein